MVSVNGPRFIAVLRLPEPAPRILTFGNAIVTAMTNNVHFPSPSPSLATVTSDITAATAAEVAALTRARGTASVRDQKLSTVVKDLHQLKNGVQAVADANPGLETTII